MNTSNTPSDNSQPGDNGQQHDQAQQPTAPAQPAREWWEPAMDWISDRAQDVTDAYDTGLAGAATWIKAAVVAAGAIVVGLILWGVLEVIAWIAGWTMPTIDLPDAPRGTGLVATLTTPIETYLQAHTAGLPVTATTAYAAWQLLGAGALVLGWLGTTGGRLTWTAWGAASVAMVWHGTPDPGRPVATGLAVLAWTAASTLALHGLTLRPSITHITTR
ncbi:hypothetical protein [Streptomyces sp. 8K308]|uniref:hypothetical protein n=1 Tax=Streptomyces sp. 8K308 TaxID=2530388 RepID=UPI0014055DD6|nr:hypothetical protein [Streptomyces sp. 8K308]